MHQPYKSYLSSLMDYNFDDLLAHHQAFFGNARMDENGGGPAAPGDVPGVGPATDGEPGDGGSDQGYPPKTPLTEMTVEQREAYWKAQARKHESRASKFGDLTPETLATLREKADAHDALERELMSDRDKAVLDAKDATKAELSAQFTDRLVKAEFKAAAAGRLDSDRLAKILEPLDLSKFVGSNGEVDEAKVAAYVDDVAPKGTQTPKGPSSNGLGSRQDQPRERGSQGRAMAEKRFGKPAGATS